MSYVNTGIEERIRNIEINTKRSLPEAVSLHPHSRSMAIVCGGPSLKDQILKIRFRKSKKADIWATNGTHDYLISKGIIPNYFSMLDSREESSKFVKNPNKKVIYFIASQCHPSVFDALENHKVFIWHSHEPELQETIVKNSKSPEVLMVQGGSTIGLRLLCLGPALGYRSIHHYGMDSSYQQDHHAYPQSLNDGEEKINVDFLGKTFTCSPWMLTQAEDYQKTIEALSVAGVRVYSHGTGLIPFIHKQHIGENNASSS